MLTKITARFVLLSLCLAYVAIVAAAQVAGPAADGARPSASQINWRESLKQPPAWYGGEEAVRVADNVLLYQQADGGWPKNIDMAASLSARERAEVIKEQSEAHSTIDNGATYTQLIYLARVYSAKRLERHRDSFLRGLDYLLKAQYDNGGWPQYYPLRKGYYSHITFNDGATAGVLRLLREVARRKAPYDFVDDERRTRAAKAVEKGVELILKAQVSVGGRRTAWGAQHDEVTLAPAPARKFEPAALASAESAGLVRFLMGLERPDERVVAAVEAAVEWFRASKIEGVRWVERRDAAQPGGFVRTAVKDPQAPPIWARFYELGTNRPVFTGRDGVVRYDVSEIEAERRNGYAWYVDSPAEVLEEEYPKWRRKWRTVAP